ncbi:MAG: biotin transporter BioY [Oscillibacter sp.]|nr:biotin transporter BioY [Oscillibacter sp.]MBR1690501.1 biotin transporter BioY [Oscillibacter sp.]
MPASSAAPGRLQTRDLTYIALFAVGMAVCAWISIPVPKPLVPFTLQTFAVFLALNVLGGRRGLYAVLVYLLLGAVGVPVFAGFRGGLDVLLGSTGGYIVGFVGSALVYWLLTARLGQSLAVRAAGCLAGLALCYAFGTAWFLAVYTASTGPLGLVTALGWCVFPFILPDLLKLGLALAVARRVGKFLR